jgi:hypothetical protein
MPHLLMRNLTYSPLDLEALHLVEHIVAAIGPESAAKILKVPLSAMVAWITRKIMGDKPQDVDPVMRQSVELEREKTTKVTVLAMRDVAVAAIQASQTAQQRQVALIAQYEQELSTVPEQSIRDLATKLRPSLIDIARPTLSSASCMSLSVNRDDPVLYMDEQTSESLKGNQIDNLQELTSARFIQYNVETGWGKVRLPWRVAPYRFLGGVSPIYSALTALRGGAESHDVGGKEKQREGVRRGESEHHSAGAYGK